MDDRQQMEEWVALVSRLSDFSKEFYSCSLFCGAREYNNGTGVLPVFVARGTCVRTTMLAVSVARYLEVAGDSSDDVVDPMGDEVMRRFSTSLFAACNPFQVFFFLGLTECEIEDSPGGRGFSFKRFGNLQGVMQILKYIAKCMHGHLSQMEEVFENGPKKPEIELPKLGDENLKDFFDFEVPSEEDG